MNKVRGTWQQCASFFANSRALFLHRNVYTTRCDLLSTALYLTNTVRGFIFLTTTSGFFHFPVPCLLLHFWRTSVENLSSSAYRDNQVIIFDTYCTWGWRVNGRWQMAEKRNPKVPSHQSWNLFLWFLYRTIFISRNFRYINCYITLENLNKAFNLIFIKPTSFLL